MYIHAIIPEKAAFLLLSLRSYFRKQLPMRTKLSHFNFELPENLIAKYPTPERHDSRLMVIHRETGEIEHKKFITYCLPVKVLHQPRVQADWRRRLEQWRTRHVSAPGFRVVSSCKCVICFGRFTDVDDFFGAIRTTVWRAATGIGEDQTGVITIRIGVAIY